jgi:hypothetical protein
VAMVRAEPDPRPAPAGVSGGRGALPGGGRTRAVYLRDRAGNPGRVLSVRVMVPQDEPVLPSIAFLWPNAEWSEREATRAYGVRFRKDADVSRAAGIPKEKTG